MRIQILFAVIFLQVTFSFQAYAKTARFDVVRDVWISAYPGEENFNMGASSKFKIKGIQEMVLIDFELSSLKGKKVESARLYFCDTNTNNKLRKIGISTVASTWIEGRSKGYFVDLIGKGATFSYSSYQRQKWAGNKSDLTDVTMGCGYTLQYHTELQREKGMWWSVDVDPQLVQLLVIGKSHGLLIMDESGQTFTNNYVFSRESKGSTPYVVITFSEVQKKPPGKLEVELLPSYENAHMKFGAAILRVLIKEELLAFDMYINGKEVPLWKLPRPGAKGITKNIVLDWLPPEERIDIKILAVDEIGQRSAPTLVTGYSSKGLPEVVLNNCNENDNKYNKKKQYDFGFVHSSDLEIWAVPELTKIDPVSGGVLPGTKNVGFDKLNPIWNHDKNEISLLGIKGEIVGFQLVIEKDLGLPNEFTFEPGDLIGNKGERISQNAFRFFRIHYLNKGKYWYPELAIPMQIKKLPVVKDKSFFKNRKNQLVYVEFSIPYGIKSDSYKGSIKVYEHGKMVKLLQVNLEVADIEMPKRLSFVPELNMYKGPGKVGTDKFYEAHRIAHEHRSVINRVPYSQDGRIHEDMIPKISYIGNNRFNIEWSGYDKKLGPLFNGTAFANGDRNGIPVEKFYLPFFENWPTNINLHYKYNQIENKSQGTISRHALESPSINNGFTLEYKERFVSVVKEFIRHFEEKNWNQTEFQFYLNNKWKWKGASSWWNLDEPISYDDWMALRFFGELFHHSKGNSSIPFIFRADISRPRWQHDWLNGILQRMYVQNKSLFLYSDRVRSLKDAGNINFSVYGSINDIESSNYETVLWCLRAFVEGADGVLPWQTLANSKAFYKPDRNALIVDAKKILGIDWVVSVRLKALRRGQQDVELLIMLEKKFGYKREQIRDLFYNYFNKREMFAKKKANNTIHQSQEWKVENFRKALIGMLCVN
ncbi:MAG: hypothetical protein ACYSTS_14060 [Planctomycetota bacterium]|jgi:hypothetical protein